MSDKAPKFQITSDEEYSGATVYIDGEPYTVSSSHPEWDKIVKLLLAGKTSGDDLLAIITPAVEISKSLEALSERFAVQGGNILFDGDILDNALTKHILKIKDGKAKDKASNYAAFVNFAEKLYTNPSQVSQEHLFKFVEANGIQIHPDGDMILYKGVTEKNLSTNAGYGIVTLPDGSSTIYEKDFLPNHVGYTVSIPRSMVDDNRNRTCSNGLHAGAYAYGSTFSKKLLTVKVNPRDVVAVPYDSNNQKVRISRYVVIANTKRDGTNDLTYRAPVAKHKKSNAQIADEVAAAKIASAPAPTKATRAKVQPAPPAGVEAPAKASGKIDFETRVERMKALIVSLPKGTNLRSHRSKKVTAANRPAFDQALIELGGADDDES